ncbi:MAG: DEAD/DEAH box helicase [Elusimicrobiota bacterium]
MSFENFNLDTKLLNSINSLGFHEPTPVQHQAIPPALLGNDIRVCSQTGSGKTISFVIPIVNSLLSDDFFGQRALILVPTRELGIQVESVFEEVLKPLKMKSIALLGGMGYDKQLHALKTGAKIVVGTPGRLLDHLEQRSLKLDHIKFLVLDESDRMLDMGFMPDIRRIISRCPEKRQTMLYSATYPPEIQRLVAQIQKDPVLIDLSSSTTAPNITQIAYPISKSQKEIFLLKLLEVHHIDSVLIFSKTKQGADYLVSILKKNGKSVSVIHSDRTQTERNEAIKRFKEKKDQILVATDIASRGIDIKDISHVINYDVPEHSEDYVHRIGRTGRASASGDAFTLICPEEEPYFKRIEKFINAKITRGMIEGFPYLVKPNLNPKEKSLASSFGSIRRRIPMGKKRF